MIDQALKLELDAFRVVVDGLELDQGHVLLQHLARVADVDGRLHLVAGEHPELYAALHEVRDGVRHVLLERVFYRRGADQVQIFLDLGGSLGHLLLPACGAAKGVVPFLEPGLPPRACEVPLAQNERSKPLAGVSGQMLVHELRRFARLGPFEHDVVGPLGVQDELSALVLDQDAHSLSSAVEGDRGVDLELLLPLPDALGVDRHGAAGPLDKGETQVGGGRDKRLLVWALRLVLDLPRLLVLVQDDRVTEPQAGHEVVPLLPCPRFLLEFGHGEAPESGVAHVLAHGVALGANAGLLEAHDILGQGASFVAEDVLDLAEIAAQVASPGRRRYVLLLVVHLDVVVDVVSVSVVAHLDSDVEADWDEVIVKDEEGEEVAPDIRGRLPGAVGIQRGIFGKVVPRPLVAEVPQLRPLPLLENHVADHGQRAQDALRAHDQVDSCVDGFVDVRQLGARLATVLDDFRVAPGVDAGADAEFGISQGSPPQEHIPLVDGSLLSGAVDRAGEGVDEGVRSLVLDGHLAVAVVEVDEGPFVVEHRPGPLLVGVGAVSNLQVGLAVNVCGFDVGG
mmetsp:Transcript_19380/g.35998  ORF Transcript_19380/g.35998 Transcript_19380/m.35998 type:complete len:566 (-) Transcript_19380:758-2455(-)